MMWVAQGVRVLCSLVRKSLIEKEKPALGSLGKASRLIPILHEKISRLREAK